MAEGFTVSHKPSENGSILVSPLAKGGGLERVGGEPSAPEE